MRFPYLIFLFDKNTTIFKGDGKGSAKNDEHVNSNEFSVSYFSFFVSDLVLLVHERLHLNLLCGSQSKELL